MDRSHLLHRKKSRENQNSETRQKIEHQVPAVETADVLIPRQETSELAEASENPIAKPTLDQLISENYPSSPGASKGGITLIDIAENLDESQGAETLEEQISPSDEESLNSLEASEQNSQEARISKEEVDSLPTVEEATSNESTVSSDSAVSDESVPPSENKVSIESTSSDEISDPNENVVSGDSALNELQIKPMEESDLEESVSINSKSLPVSLPHRGSPGGLIADSLSVFQCASDKKYFTLHLLNYRVPTLGSHPICEILYVEENTVTIKAYAHYQRVFCNQYVERYISQEDNNCVSIVKLSPYMESSAS